MSKEVRWAKPAIKDLERLDAVTRERVRVAVRRFAESGQGDVRRLQGREPPVFRLRVGHWRVIFLPDEPAAILILRVLPRGSAYSP